MKAIDQDGLLLCELQARTFELSVEMAEVSSAVFVRRFMRSEAAKWLDKEAVLTLNIQPADLLSMVEEQYGPSTYGSVRFSKNEMYWIGYLYRYYAYTYEQPSISAYKLIKPDELRGLFLPYHTLDPAQAIERILQAKGRTPDTELMRQYEIFKKVRERGLKGNGKDQQSGVGSDRKGAGERQKFRSAKEREDYLLEEFRSQGVIIRRDVEQTLCISQPAAVLILRKLVEEGRLVREGGGRNVWYKISSTEIERV